jgi:K+-sensing histidine kinase KdpD
MKVLGNVLGNIFGALLALALTAALGYYGYIAAKRFVVLFARLDFTVAMVTATATMALLLAAMIIAGSIRRAAQQNAAAQRRADKAETYKLFISQWEETLRPGQTAEAIIQLSRQMQDVNHLLLLHGCTSVVKAHAAMQTLDLREARAKLADTILDIRKDMGLESRGLDAKELVQLLLSPSEKMPSASRPGAHQDTQPRVSLAPN